MSVAAKLRKSHAEQMKMVEDWNRTIKVGQAVDYRSMPDGPAKRCRTSTEAQMLSEHTAVVWLDGVSGCVALRACTPVPMKPVGILGGLCNREACRIEGADWWNHSTRAYYCNGCAQMINEADRAGEGVKLYGHPICTPAQSVPVAAGDDSEGGTHD